MTDKRAKLLVSDRATRDKHPESLVAQKPQNSSFFDERRVNPKEVKAAAPAPPTPPEGYPHSLLPNQAIALPGLGMERLIEMVDH